MNQISILCRSIPLVAIFASCSRPATPEPKTSAGQESSQPASRVFQSAIAVRDESVTAFFGHLGRAKPAPPTLSIAFYDGAGAVLETVSNLDVQATSAGFVYAA